MLKVMLVDDEPLLRMGLKQAFDWDSVGCVVVAEAENGAEALEKYNDAKPDIIITDIRMSAKDGLQLIAALREGKSDAEIIVLSGYDDFSYAKQAMEAGVFSYLLKPVNLDELTNTLKSLKEKIDLASSKNVTVKNSSVVGHRDVGALIGGMQSAAGTLTLKNNITFDNVKVKTTGGRSGLVVGKVITSNGCSVKFESGADLAINNSAMSIYNDKNLEQKFAAGETVPTEWKVSNTVNIEGQDQFIYSYKGLNKTSGEKEYVAYGYKADALVLVQNVDTWTAITNLTELKKGVNVK